MSSVVEDESLAAARRLSHGEQLARSARRHPERTAVRCGAATITYAGLDKRVTRAANALARLGVERGDRVGILMHNGIEFVEVFYACARLGTIAVPINFRLVADEIAYILGDCTPTVFVVEAALQDRAGAAVDQLVDAPSVLVTSDGATTITGACDYESTVQSSSAEPVVVDVAESDPICILYTSGTTGRPKGAVITHFSLAVQSLTRAHAQQMRFDGEIWLSGLQLFHVGGLSALLPTIMLGGQLITLPPTSNSATEIVDILARQKVTMCSLIPTQWKEVCALPGIEDQRFGLRKISWGTAAAEPGLLRRLDEVFAGVEIYNLFGQTETCGVSCTLPGEEAIANRGSVGRPVVNMEVRIVDDAMADVPTDQVGEIVYRGPTLLREYWNDPEATADAFRGGWFHSGDLGRRDANGLIWIVDRIKDMIISGGENIYSAEVEGAIAAHPKVAEVAVIGVPHERWGETPLAIVVPVDPADPPIDTEIIAHCRNKLASYKKPSAVVVTEALPRNSTGKVQKFKLRDDFRISQREGE
ncbi:long-chain-fatty-acid--CoA ligase [Saccharopolyspora shandongensis]|uniref:long-chain-fatty-acid--CoA ligase n=1 Tax=Saccharopolyspora shandongensis TaxID=418495 RepID=UPI0034111E66